MLFTYVHSLEKNNNISLIMYIKWLCFVVKGFEKMLQNFQILAVWCFPISMIMHRNRPRHKKISFEKPFTHPLRVQLSIVRGWYSVGKSEGFLRRILTDVSRINHESGQTSVHHRRIIRHQNCFSLSTYNVCCWFTLKNVVIFI